MDAQNVKVLMIVFQLKETCATLWSQKAHLNINETVAVNSRRLSGTWIRFIALTCSAPLGDGGGVLTAQQLASDAPPALERLTGMECEVKVQERKIKCQHVLF